MIRALYAMQDEGLRSALFSGRGRERLGRLGVAAAAGVVTDFDAVPDSILSGVDVLVTGWGAPRLDARTLDRMPRLRLVCHAGGSVKGHLGPEVWERGITVTSAVHANAVPVAELTLAWVLMACKDVLRARQLYGERQVFIDREQEFATAGVYRRTIGIVGASTIGRLVIERLRAFDLDLLLYDPTVTSEEAVALGTAKVTLRDLVQRSDVVTLHAPVLPETVGMVGAEELGLMPDGATLVNTARGLLVDHDALCRELVSGRLSAYLDVTEPEPLPPGDPLNSLPNVLLTPHIAGAMGTELQRLGDAAVTEIERHVAGATPLHPVDSEALVLSA